MNMRINALFLVSLTLFLGLASCDSDLFHEERTAKVDVSLQAAEGVQDVENAVITLKCLENGCASKPVSVSMEKSAAGKFSATLPINYLPDMPFIEVVLDGETYGYSVADTYFEDGRRYKYSLMLDADGLTEAQNNNDISDWEQGGNETVDATM